MDDEGDILREIARRCLDDSGDQERRLERFEAFMGFRRVPGFGQMPLTQEDRESLVAGVIEEYLASRPEEASRLRHRTSARIQLRLPRILHQQVAERAVREGVSMNTFLVAATASAVERSSARDVTHEAAERHAAQSPRVSWQR